MSHASSLLDVDGAVLKVVSFLTANDTLTLHAVSREWREFLSTHEEKVFHLHLKHEFAEGRLLSYYVAGKMKLPRKALYRAFRRRWTVPSQREQEERVCIPWVRPDTNEGQDQSENGAEGQNATPILGSSGVEGGDCVAEKKDDGDGDAAEKSETSAADDSNKSERATDEDGDDCGLVFIGRVGAVDHPFSCVALKMEDSRYSQKLVVDKEAMYSIPMAAWIYQPDQYAPLIIPPQSTQALDLLSNLPPDEDVTAGPTSSSISLIKNEEWEGDFNHALRESYHLTLHVVDVRTCQILSFQIPIYDRMNSSVYKATDGSGGMVVCDYGSQDIYGIPPRYSPKYRVFNAADFRRLEVGYPWDEDFPPIDTLSVYADEFDLRYDYDEDGVAKGMHGYSEDLSFHLGGEFGNINRPQDVCCFLRAIMKEQCEVCEITSATLACPAVTPERPAWLQSDVIVDAITQYSSFEDQAGRLRLVCRHFQASGLRQLEQKLTKNKAIGPGATVGYGWSQDCLTSKESCVEDALWLASCKCTSRYCKDKGSCPTASVPPTYTGYQVKSETLDVEKAKKELTEKGRIGLTKLSPSDFESEHYDCCNEIECNFEEKKLGIYQLCDEVDKVIRKYTSWEEYGEAGPLNGDLKRRYGVSGEITTKQFIRSLFLVLAKPKIANDGDKEGAPKRARLAGKDEVTIGTAKSQIYGVKGDSYSRMKKIYRFHSAAHGPMEICLEYRSTHRGGDFDFY